ncbi:3'-5' exonuclease [Neolewinella persica]|uniref:3'-5' exonuclease n=1 Tax=Neolewinella persica TaxID=70998 RepID=UPI00035D0505|nr:3'-5' exonuclease [Neolewinella persica]
MEGREWLEELKKMLSGRKKDFIDPQWPDWYRDYATKCMSNRRDDDLPIQQATIVVIDAETTGLDLKNDTLISLGGLKILGTTIFVNGHFEGYLPTPEKQEDKGAVAIHGILPHSSRYTYELEEELLVRLLAFLGTDAIIVGHHIGFDVEMINQALARQGGGPLKNRVIDTGKIAERLQPAGYWTPKDKFTLDSLASRYRIPLSDRHTALGDAYITAVLWLKLTARLREKMSRPLVLGDFV